MPPAINPRKAMGLAKDIQALLRCRNAIAIDTTLDADKAKTVLHHLDEAVKVLIELKRDKEMQDRESGELPRSISR